MSVTGSLLTTCFCPQPEAGVLSTPILGHTGHRTVLTHQFARILITVLRGRGSQGLHPMCCVYTGRQLRATACRGHGATVALQPAGGIPAGIRGRSPVVAPASGFSKNQSPLLQRSKIYMGSNVPQRQAFPPSWQLDTLWQSAPELAADCADSLPAPHL